MLVATAGPIDPGKTWLIRARRDGGCRKVRADYRRN